MSTEEERGKSIDLAAEQLAAILLAQIEEKIISRKKNYGKEKPKKDVEDSAGATL